MEIARDFQWLIMADMEAMQALAARRQVEGR